MKVDNRRAAGLAELSAKAFRGPWRYAEFEIDCDECGESRPIIEVQAPNEYPQSDDCPQCVAQQEFSISVPGIGELADANGALIVALRNTVEDLLSDRAEAHEIIRRLLASAKYYLDCKVEWWPSDKEHNDAIEKAEALLASVEGARKGTETR